MTTRVINIRDLPRGPLPENHIYIGRANKSRGLEESRYANKFIIGRDGTREDVVRKNRISVLADPDLVEQGKKELTGKILVCWCSPESCHGDTWCDICDNGLA